ncbi:Heterogeneous nuclear ribonucleoprotein K, partial [Temnothorax longispinosus]
QRTRDSPLRRDCLSKFRFAFVREKSSRCVPHVGLPWPRPTQVPNGWKAGVDRRVIYLRVKVAGSIIGKGGQNITKLRSQNGSRHGSDEIDVRMLVHQSQAGCIIGKGGLKIKELREVSQSFPIFIHDS